MQNIKRFRPSPGPFAMWPRFFFETGLKEITLISGQTYGWRSIDLKLPDHGEVISRYFKIRLFKPVNVTVQTKTLISRHFKIRFFKPVNSTLYANNSTLYTKRIRLYNPIGLKNRILKIVFLNQWYLQSFKNKGFLAGIILAPLKTLKTVVKRYVVTTMRAREVWTANGKA